MVAAGGGTPSTRRVRVRSCEKTTDSGVHEEGLGSHKHLGVMYTSTRWQVHGWQDNVAYVGTGWVTDPRPLNGDCIPSSSWHFYLVTSFAIKSTMT